MVIGLLAQKISCLGDKTITSIQRLGDMLYFAVSSIMALFFRPFIFTKITHCIYEIGVRCTLVVCIIGLFCGMVLGLQGYYAFAQFQAESLLGSAIALTLIRELGPVLTALMIVGQAGSALTAELGAQRHSEQIDALKTMQIHPMGYLIGPRIIAALIAFPILTTFFNWLGLLGGYITGVLLLHLDSHLYWHEVYTSIQTSDMWGGYSKTIVFGFLTVLVCSYQGYHSHRLSHLKGIRAIGANTTQAVVTSSIVILISDYLITSFFI